RVAEIFSSSSRFLSDSKDVEALDVEISNTFRALKARYQKLEVLIGKGLIRSAKDVSEGGLLTTLFEMSLGRSLGMQIEDIVFSRKKYFGEGLGAFVLTCDLHQISELEAQAPELKRLGVIMKDPLLRFGDEVEWDLLHFKRAYLSRTLEGFWS